MKIKHIVFILIGALAVQLVVNREVIAADNYTVQIVDKVSTPGDSETLSALKNVDSHMDKARPVRFFLYFKTAENAQAAAKELSETGYSIAPLHINGSSKEWSVVASKVMVPTENELHQIRVSMEGLTKQFAGDYDGWESAVVK